MHDARRSKLVAALEITAGTKLANLKEIGRFSDHTPLTPRCSLYRNP